MESDRSSEINIIAFGFTVAGGIAFMLQASTEALANGIRTPLASPVGDAARTSRETRPTQWLGYTGFRPPPRTKVKLRFLNPRRWVLFV